MASRLSTIREQREKFPRMIAACESYLLPGKYHVKWISGKKFALKYGKPEQRGLKSVYRALAYGKYRVKNTSQKYACNMVMESPFHTFKMFNDTEGLIYTKSSTPQLWKNHMLFYDKMRPYFPNGIVSIDETNMLMVEKYFRTKKIQEEKSAFDWFFDSYKLYLDSFQWNSTLNVQQVMVDMNTKLLPDVVQKYVNYILNKIEDKTIEYPVILCHNDVCVDNILTEDNRDFYLTDFELCGYNVFFSDIMGLIFNSVVMKKDPVLFAKYMAGEMDSVFSEIFDKFGLKYARTDRLQYLYIFLIFKIYLVWKNSERYLSFYAERIWKFEEELRDQKFVE